MTIVPTSPNLANSVPSKVYIHTQAKSQDHRQSITPPSTFRPTMTQRSPNMLPSQPPNQSIYQNQPLSRHLTEIQTSEQESHTPHSQSASTSASQSTSNVSIAKPHMHRSESFPTHHGYSYSHGQSQSPEVQNRPNLNRRTTMASSPESGFRIGTGILGGGGSGNGSASEELTTKGRKRKRLAKACSACHKNKRRCDGFAPCSNCEFSSRPCLYLNAQGQQIPPPRTRETTLIPASSSNTNLAGLGKTSIDGESTSASVNGQERRDDDPEVGIKLARGDDNGNDTWGRSILELVDRDANIHFELIDLFFTRLHPLPSMLHLPTFTYRTYLNLTSPILLHSIYALSVRFSTNAGLLSLYPTDQPNYTRGEIFAELATQGIKAVLDRREEADMKGWEQLEFVTSVYLLSCYYAAVRNSKMAIWFLDLSINLIRPMIKVDKSQSNSPIRPFNQSGSRSKTKREKEPSPKSIAEPVVMTKAEKMTLESCKNRTFWLIVLHDLCASANGRPRRIGNMDVEGVDLPGEELSWERYGGSHTYLSSKLDGDGEREGEVARRDDILGDASGCSKVEDVIGELGQVMRILSIFANIMGIVNGSEERGKASQYEHDLKSWALALPRYLQFDETTLPRAITLLQSPIQSQSASGWLFTYMHALAECGMFYLQAALASSPVGANSGTDGWDMDGVNTAQRQSQAVENLLVILEAIGEKGRQAPLMMFPLLVVTNWQDHLKSTPNLGTVQPHQTRLEERLNTWWGEVNYIWGFERIKTLDTGFYPGMNGNIIPPTPTPPLQPSQSQFQHHYVHRNSISIVTPSTGLGLGLYRAQSTSPPRLSLPESVSSVSSIINLPTPSPSSYSTKTISFPVNGHGQGTGRSIGSSSASGGTSTSTLGPPQLPPLRPRANTLAFPIPAIVPGIKAENGIITPEFDGGYHRGLPSISGLSDKSDSILELPPLNSTNNGLSWKSTTTPNINSSLSLGLGKYGLFEKPPGSGPGSGSGSGINKEEHIRFDPYSFNGKSNGRGRSQDGDGKRKDREEDGLGSADIARDRERQTSPFSIGNGNAVPRKDWSGRDWSGRENGRGLAGIQALISAAGAGSDSRS